jgi:hypothetical protein
MKGIIYKIVCNETGEVYYGSTTKPTLNIRISGHKCSFKRWKEGKTNYMTSFQILERGNYSYSLIETVECEDRKQLEQRERYYIENNECINKNIVGRTVKEWYDANNEYLKFYRKQKYLKDEVKVKELATIYRQVNRNLINEKQRQRRAKAKEQSINNN